MEAKCLREVLPNLKTAEHMMELLDEIMVTRLAMPRDRSSIRIYIDCGRLIAKKDIYMLEAAIKKQFFANKPITVKIFESYHLENQTAEQILQKYRDSILLELKGYHLLDYHLFQSAECNFETESILVLTVEDNLVNRSHAQELCRILEKIFNERLHCPLEVRCHLGEKKHAVYARYEDEVAVQAGEIAQKAAEARETEKSHRKAAAEKEAKAREYRKHPPKGKLLDPEDGFGRDFEGENLPIDQIDGEIGEVIIEGDIFKVDTREIRTGNTIIMFAVTDRTDSIMVKIFATPENKGEIMRLVSVGNHVRIKGRAVLDRFDSEITIGSVQGIKKTESVSSVRKDLAPVKRVELHCHTKMSDMDGVSDVKSIVKRAISWGHKAIAITDHGVVQSFVDAMHASEKSDIKIIYGCEGYLVDDTKGESDMEVLKKERARHVIILAKNEIGRVNLYRLVSESHLKYFYKRPRIPKSLLQECREGLIIGSACEAGELFRAIVNHESDEEIARLVNFYDYLEIQPIGNNAFMLRDPKYGLSGEEDLRNFNRKIVDLGEQFGKPVVATCDVHFLDPEDEIYRRILMKGQGFSDADSQPPLYLHTTEEMLEEFDYLGKEKAVEVVVTNPNKIADCCEPIKPVRPDKCPPVIEGSDRDLRQMCYDKAHSIYGDPLPAIVEERLEHELHSIISNGFAVMYIIAQKLVWKSNDDGYLVGSRGSVGSSFVATMSGITEVNPLSPHYVCPHCKYSDFDSPEVKQFGGGAGCDMPDRTCPRCGTLMKKDGFDIPFETFLGFKGDKEPDIDLNFSGEYQSHAHAFTEVIFGKGHTFRAGTIGTLADKTAYGFVLKYFEEKNQVKRRCEIERIAEGCVGVRRSTGQHPGGIIVMPHGENIYSFTPIQHPANDMTTKTVTTHFDYHSIDHNLLKLDILGHDDPTMIRRLEDLTGLDAKSFPLDSPEVMSLFQNTTALGITPEDIGGTRLGALGVPEFGTDFAMQMLIDAKPTCFSDLVRIAGLAHGTDVWLGNAQTLILEGKATIQTAICTRDDIMIYLISMGMDKSLSFNIMEKVRKGKGLTPEWIEAMKAANVPDWYIESCQKIKYMFPKAHAAAYVMMAWRIAYCKVFYPLAYYAAFFGIRATGFNYEMMCQGPEILEQHLETYRRNQDNLTEKEKATFRDMRIVQEMYARGYEFMPIDLYRCGAKDFQIYDGKIMPSLCSIDGMGEKAAEAAFQEAKKGKFLSVEDFCQRTKTSKTVAETMDQLGLFGNLPKTNQISLFDLELM
ncbi:MAG: PolC-type DNA polymerase III [Clostridiales bacterium]|nr:PolC-type DNA polymerase III [Clostridiales bacterium]